MAVGVVEALEVVQVQHDQAELAAVALCRAHLRAEVIDEGAVVVDTGQTVGEAGGGERRL